VFPIGLDPELLYTSRIESLVSNRPKRVRAQDRKPGSGSRRAAAASSSVSSTTAGPAAGKATPAASGTLACLPHAETVFDEMLQAVIHTMLALCTSAKCSLSSPRVKGGIRLYVH
jgi:hypothetical protein